MKKSSILLSTVVLLACSCAQRPTTVKSLTADMVETRIGTDAADMPSASIFGANGEVYGNCLPCVTEPHGMTFWTPQTDITEKKGVAPYYYGAKQWMGFRASHWMTGSATQDYGSFYLIPGCASVPMDHSIEEANPAYYRYGHYEMTARSRSAIFRLDTDSLIVGVNTIYEAGSISFVDGKLMGENPVHRIYQGWGTPAGYSGWMYAEFSRPVVKAEYVGAREMKLTFEPSETPLMVRMGTSFRSAEGAAANLAAEIMDWDFDTVRATTQKVWNGVFAQIEVEGEEEAVRHFYSSLWRTSLLPRTVSDFSETPDYDDFSLWDTFRALHPLLTILHPHKSGEMIQAIVRKYKRGGWLPIFPCWGSYTSAMIGDHAVSIIADAYAKGIRNFDVATACEAVRKNAFETPDSALYKDGRGRRALEPYMRLGYLPLEEHVTDAFHRDEQTSRTLEYAYDDWCASLLLDANGYKDDAATLKARSANWRNVFDPRTKYPQGRHGDGTFLNDDNYLTKTRFITEGTPCHYSWFVPHDIDGLVEYLGKEEFEARLDSMFSEKRYWHGNEPCHQVAYLYDWIGRPDKTQKVVADILRSEYRNTPGGLSGNDDAGQMSAWYVFSSLGFYPVCPGSGEYALGIPTFSKATVHLENGHDFVITRNDNCTGKYHLGRKTLKAPFLKHGTIMDGGNLQCE
ncbi:MAG: GH92 family glycosyl hydrolase [Bacteroidales bacterium]|nr:GH92 family glycosyl hydrolase [Bacteroidales bacterium]